MKKQNVFRAAVAGVAFSAANAALAAGDSGTSSMGEMSISGAQFGMLIGGLVGLAAVIWVVTKVVSR
jgi:hypothetical protein